MPRSKARLLHRDTSIISRFPVEILTMIFLLLGPSSLKNPYVYLPLSWVCRRWRSIVFDTSKFWSVITHNCHSRRTRDFTPDVIFRSRSREVDVALCSPQDCNGDSTYITSCILSFKHFEIRTLLLQGRSDFDFETKNLTQLENLILSRVPIHGRNQQSFDKFLSAVNPRFIELPASLLHKKIPQSLNRLEWLKLDLSRSTHFNDNVNMSIVYRVLEALPNLRILNLISGQSASFNDARPAITLPNLRMLSLDPGIGGFRSIRTPALSYLAVSACILGAYDWDHLNGIDLSMVKSFRIALCYCQREPFYRLPVTCISTGHSEEDCEFFNNFHAPVSASNGAMDHHWTLPPTNSFHISFWWSDIDHTRGLYFHLKQATNLVELIVDCRSMKSNDWGNSNDQEKYQNFLGEALNNFDTVTRLTVLRCRSFVSACGLLMDGRRLPRLEKLSYEGSFRPTCSSKIVPTRMAMVRDARIKAGSQPLKILELKKFLFIPQKQVKEIENLGIQLIQSDFKKCQSRSRGLYRDLCASLGALFKIEPS